MVKLNSYSKSIGFCFGNFTRIAILLALFIPSCVTTSTGGFTPVASDDQALQDYVRLAIAYYDADDMAGAKRHINNALAINDKNSDIYNILALVLQREGDMDLADDAFRRAISLDRTNSRARNNYAAFLFSRERFNDAFEQLELVTADTNYEGRAMAFENLGRSALKVGRNDDAETAFERALQLNGNLYFSALELADINFKQRNLPAARSAFNQYLTNREFFNIPHTPRSLWIGIQIEEAFQNSEVAEDYARLLTALYQDSPEYQLYRIRINGN